MDADRNPEIPAVTDVERPRVGVDEWVAEVSERRERRRGLAGLVERAISRVPPAGRLAFFVLFAATLPLWMTSRGDLFAYGIFTLIYVLLGLGLNVVVGYAGLLDLGYAAFFGFGAYLYALLSSTHTSKGYTYSADWPAELSIPVVVAATAVVGLLLGLTSRRLLGDYLAIVTLFFGQAFVVFVSVTDWRGLTGGPNGLADIDPLDFFGYELTSRKQQYYFLLIAAVLVLIGLHFLSESRTGRAWRALREDPLAAEAMSIPVNRLKLLAFALGAGIAGLAGCIFASILGAITGGNFDLPTLITIYVIVILGGLGSLTGVVLGAVVINVSFQFLAPEAEPLHLGGFDEPGARLLFYAVILVLILVRVRPWWKVGAVLGGLVGLGVVTNVVVEALAPSWAGGRVVNGGSLRGAIEDWVLIPPGHERFGTLAYVALVALVIAVAQVRGPWRTVLAVPTIYLAAIVWENILVEEPAVTRLILYGALLVTLMRARPQGLLGTPRVEIV